MAVLLIAADAYQWSDVRVSFPLPLMLLWFRMLSWKRRLEGWSVYFAAASIVSALIVAFFNRDDIADSGFGVLIAVAALCVAIAAVASGVSALMKRANERRALAMGANALQRASNGR